MKFYNKMFQRGLVIMLLCLLVPALTAFAATETAETAKKRVLRGAETFSVQGYARHWDDVKKTPYTEGLTSRKMRPVLNFDPNPKLVNSSDTDTAVQRDYTRRAVGMVRTMLQMALPFLNVDGLDLVGWGNGIPPDTTGAVGLTYYIQAVNTAFGIFRKSDGVMVSATTFDNFFGGPGIVGTPCDNENNGDPIVLFDRYAQRWFILDFAWDPALNDGSYYSVAVSQTSDPTGAWWLYAMRAHNTWMNDYPKCGVWHDGIYITANMFNFSTSAFQGVQVWALNKTDLYSGTLTVQTVFDNGFYARSMLPSNAKSPAAPAAGTPNYVFSLDASEFGGGHQDQLSIWEYDVDWNNSANTTWTGPTLLPTAIFGLVGTDVPQSGTTQRIDSLAGRLMFPATYREFDGHAAVYLNHVVELAGRRTKRWYEVRYNAGTPSIYQQGTYAPDTHHRFMGSAAADEDGNIALGYSVSSSAMNPAIRYTGRSAINPTLNQMNLGENVIINGTGSQTNYDRWGDYTTMSIDPTDDKTFWYTNEYHSTNGFYWKTRIAAFRIKPDLWSKDNTADIGDEPNNTTPHFWMSPDIWVRNQADGFTNQVHENPEYGQTNYMYVRIRCRDSEGHGLVKTYWAFPGTGLNWDSAWTPIGQQMTNYIASGNEQILEFPWSPPDPGAYGSGHFCLLSRIETAPQPPWGMTYPEGAGIGQNTKQNNNIVWKNITIVDQEPNGSSSVISVANMTRKAARVRLEFRAPAAAAVRAAANADGLSDTADTKNILEWGTVKVDLGKELYTKWSDADNKGGGVTADRDAANTLSVNDTEAFIEDIDLKAGEKHLIEVFFKPFDENVKDTTPHVLDVIQFDFDGKEWVETGGVRFELRPPKK